jgi:hypothetical protein
MSDSRIRKVGSASALVAAGLVAGGVLASNMTANADTNLTPTNGGTSSSSSAEAPSNATSSDTSVTGAEADKVTAAVTAKYDGVTITTVRKDPDGSYDAIGTDASGNDVCYDVSADLSTLTVGGGGHGGHRGDGAGNDTPVTGTEAEKVTAAVTAKYDGVTITTVRKDPDGSYDALGTDSSGNSVFYDVSADLSTITAGGAGHGGAPPGAEGSSASATAPA